MSNGTEDTTQTSSTNPPVPFEIPGYIEGRKVKGVFVEGNPDYQDLKVLLDSGEIKTDIDGSILTIADAPWPGFTPDLLSIVLVVATQAKGDVLIHQKMFESRLFFVDKLIDMGAKKNTSRMLGAASEASAAVAGGIQKSGILRNAAAAATILGKRI